MMQLTCTCGSMMNISLRTVIYSSKIEIDNVPVYTCESCHRSEVYPAVKSDLTSLIAQIANELEGIHSIQFDEKSELARLLVMAVDTDSLHEPITGIVEERINELLDMMLLAKSLNHMDWVEETRARLRQITDHYVIPGAAGNSY